MSFAFGWEVKLMEGLQRLLGGAGDEVGTFFTIFGEEMILVAVLGFLYWCWDKELAKRIGLMIVVGLVFNPMLKNVVLRRRPYFDHSRIKCLKPVDSGADIYDISAQGYSFPSGHSTNSAVLYWGLVRELIHRGQSERPENSVENGDTRTTESTGYTRTTRHRILLALLICLPLVVGVSRFILGVHYPTDVLCGWLMGALIVLIIGAIQRRARRKWLLYLIVFVISAAGIFYCRTEDYFTGLGLMAGFFAADLFEERYVHFENTRSPVRCIARLAGGFAIYFALNALLKLPFPHELRESATAAAYAIRFFRYVIVTFCVLGLYPLLFGRLRALSGRNRNLCK